MAIGRGTEERSSSTRQAAFCEEAAARVFESDDTSYSPLGSRRSTSSESLDIVSAHPTRSVEGMVDIAALCQVGIVRLLLYSTRPALLLLLLLPSVRSVNCQLTVNCQGRV